MSRAGEKAIRLLQIEQLLWAHPEGLTRAEIARRLQVNRSTITKYLDQDHLPPSIYVDEADGDKLKIDRAADLTRTAFNLHEILALHLATRLLATRTDKQNPHAASALRKLGLSLQRLDARISRHLLRSADVMDEAASFRDPVYLEVLHKLTEAWSAGRKVRVSHQMPDGKVFDYTFSPYMIEPYAVGQTSHVIGLREPPGKLRTFKIERLRAVEILREPYVTPEDFDPATLLRNAWGIWYSEADPVEVVLRFHPQVAVRVQETRWQRGQQQEVQPDGYLLWRAPIAEPQEMLPWIRGWGADVEVLAPEWLRVQLKQEADKLAAIYQVITAKQQFVAHVRGKDKVPQPLEAHLLGVSKLAGQFSGKLNLMETGRLLGLLHDVGKASDKFQQYLLSGEGLIDPDAEEYLDPIAHKGKIDHTTAGAQVIYQYLWNQGPKAQIAAQMLALCVASHHSGLIDCLTPEGENNFLRRMHKLDASTRKDEAWANLQAMQSQVTDWLSGPVVDQLFAKLQSLQENGKDSQATLAFKSGLLIRFLLSCLLDADRLDTADFETPGNTRLRNYGEYQPWQTLIQRLDRKLDEFEHKPDKNKVEQLRSQISQRCRDFAMQPQGIYRLTVPTGGGKTLASLRFALHHAARREHKIARIFYVIPYTSIIDQNADDIRKILEDKDEQGRYLDRVVLEHHSNLTPEEESYRHNLLAENWDAPVVFTTQVQFLEALFGSGTRSARRMHQLANSIIIFDEVQTLPIKTIHLVNVALRFLVQSCGATVVLCTATQPPLDQLAAQSRALTIEADQHIIQDEAHLFEQLKRVEVHDERKIGGWDEQEVADLAEQELQHTGSVLIVVNTKQSARNLYHALAAKELVGVQLYHLSTNMCAIHRLQVLAEIKTQLHQKSPVICVSTQLIEAGVDIDFGAVIRYLAGLDSIAQAAGRCNRHGLHSALGPVHIVNPADESIDNLSDIVIGTKVTQHVLDDFKVDPAAFGNNRIGIEAMAAYYKVYYAQRAQEMDFPVGSNSELPHDDTLFNLLATNSVAQKIHCRVHEAAPELVFPQSFQSAARLFRVIDSPTRGVITQYTAEGEAIVAELCREVDLAQEHRLLRRAQRYAVNLFPHEFQKLINLGVIYEVQPGAGVYYLDKRYYNIKFGWSDEPVQDLDLQIA